MYFLGSSSNGESNQLNFYLLGLCRVLWRWNEHCRMGSVTGRYTTMNALYGQQSRDKYIQ
jgi:hypothetical protein